MRALSNHPIRIWTRDVAGPTGKHSADPCFSYRNLRLSKCAVLIVAFLFFLAVLLSAAPSRAAGMVGLEDAELANVTGQAGISIYESLGIIYTAAVLKFSDTDSTPLHWLEFQNFTVDDGLGGPFIKRNSLDDPITLDVGTNSSGRTLISYYDNSEVLPQWYSVGEWVAGSLVGGLVVCDQPIGTLNLDALSQGPSRTRIGAHVGGLVGGFDFDYTTRISAQALRYTYNSSLAELALSGIHLAGSANGAGDDPANPATWAFTGANNVFRIGDIDTGNPAQYDVVTVDATGITSLYLNLPLQGTLRVESVAFGGNNFGPIAIDGIDVHRLMVKMTP